MDPGEARLAAFLACERYSGRQSPAQLLAKLKRAPTGRVGEPELATRRQLVLRLVSMIKLVNDQVKELERQIATAIRAHPDGPIAHRRPRLVTHRVAMLARRRAV